MAESKIIKEEGKGFLEEKQGVTILHLYGEAYTRGYQHGVLLAGRIEKLVPDVLASATAVIAKTLQCDFNTAWEKMLLGKQVAERYLPVEFKEEMKGIAEGVISQGKKISLDDIVLWNTMYDQWCLYAHPHHSKPDDSEKKYEYRDEMPGSGAGCSSFSAWGNAVEGNKLVFGKNMDNLNLPGILDNRVLAIINPAEGFGHTVTIHPGMVGIDGGFNTEGIMMMTQYDASVYETMKGWGIGIFTRMLLTYSDSIDKAISVFANPRCTGIAYHVADAKVNDAIVIEASAVQVAVRRPVTGEDVLWTSNHSNCYPGWLSYQGYNMVFDQARVYELGDVSTIEKWQKSLRDPNNLYVPAPSRFERYKELLLEQYYGKVSVDNAIAILSDRYDPYVRETRLKYTPSVSNNILATICALYKDETFVKFDDPSRIFQAHVANLWSMVATPSTGDFWLAIQDFPAQYGGYEHFNLNDELSRGE